MSASDNSSHYQDKKPYPIRFDIEYSEKLSRLTTLFRLILVIPIFVLMLSVGGGIVVHKANMVIGGGGMLFLGPLLMILFRKRYPRWWFDWNVAFAAFTQRIVSYFYCLTDQYPSVEAQQKVHVEIDYPQPESLMRGMPLVKWILAIPHFIVLLVLAIITYVVLILGWISVIIIGRYPRPLFNYMVGYMRWALRVIGYCFLLVTDIYPPFSFKP